MTAYGVLVGFGLILLLAIVVKGFFGFSRIKPNDHQDQGYHTGDTPPHDGGGQ